MTLTQAQGMMKFARICYREYAKIGKTQDAQSARKHMLQCYLIVRSLRVTS